MLNDKLAGWVEENDHLEDEQNGILNDRSYFYIVVIVIWYCVHVYVASERACEGCYFVNTVLNELFLSVYIVSHNSW